MVKLRAESEKEIEQKKDETKKKNSPSPCSYKFEESHMKTQGHKPFQMKISKSKFLKFTGNHFYYSFYNTELIAH